MVRVMCALANNFRYTLTLEIKKKNKRFPDFCSFEKKCLQRFSESMIFERSNSERGRGCHPEDTAKAPAEDFFLDEA